MRLFQCKQNLIKSLGPFASHLSSGLEVCSASQAAFQLKQTLSRFPTAKIWVTEFAYAHQSLQATQDYYNKAVNYFDDFDKIERYSYFGAFRVSRRTLPSDEPDVKSLALWCDKGGGALKKSLISTQLF